MNAPISPSLGLAAWVGALSQIDLKGTVLKCVFMQAETKDFMFNIPFPSDKQTHSYFWDAARQNIGSNGSLAAALLLLGPRSCTLWKDSKKPVVLILERAGMLLPQPTLANLAGDTLVWELGYRWCDAMEPGFLNLDEAGEVEDRLRLSSLNGNPYDTAHAVVGDYHREGRPSSDESYGPIHEEGFF